MLPPAFVVKLVNAVVPPTTPANVFMPVEFKVNPNAPFNVLPNVIFPLPLDTIGATVNVVGLLKRILPPTELTFAPRLMPLPVKVIFPPAVVLIGLLIKTVPAPVNVNDAVVDHAIGALTVILPACAPVDPVVIVTLVRPFKSAVIALFRMVALLLIGVKVPAENDPPVVDTAFTVTSRGSNNHVPFLPKGALALPPPDHAKFSLPDVSTQPPFPPWAPPCA